MSDIKTQPTAMAPEDFIASVEHQKRQADALVLLEMFNRVTELDAVMWGPSIIGYGTYTYALANGKSGIFMRTGFSPRKQNLSLYISSGMQAKPELAKKLGKHKTSKACLYINKLEDVDLDVLETLIAADMQAMTKKYPE